MIDFIEKTTFSVDLVQIRKDLESVLTQTQWAPENQIGLVHRATTNKDIWKDCVGSLYNSTQTVEISKETEFTELNPMVPEYTRDILLRFADQEKFKLGRVRYMLLNPFTGIGAHYDTTIRYHLAINTNWMSYLAHTSKKNHLTAACHHIPADSFFYKTDTTRLHFAYNGGTTPRIHLLICPI